MKTVSDTSRPSDDNILCEFRLGRDGEEDAPGVPRRHCHVEAVFWLSAPMVGGYFCVGHSLQIVAASYLGVPNGPSVFELRSAWWARELGEKTREEPHPTFIFEVQRSIRLLLQQSNTSQSDLAKALGVSAARVSQLLADDGNITLATVERIAKALNKKPRISFSPEDT